MCNSLTNQYLIQTPDYHLFTSGCLRNLFPQFKRHAKTVGCISGCVSGISPVLELDRRVLVDTDIIQQLELYSVKISACYLSFLAVGDAAKPSSLSNHRVANIIGGRRFLFP